MNLLKKLPNKTVEMVHKLAGQLFHLAEPENNLGAFLITAVRYGKKKQNPADKIIYRKYVYRLGFVQRPRWNIFRHFSFGPAERQTSEVWANPRNLSKQYNLHRFYK